jgi:hypothetical protein
MKKTINLNDFRDAFEKMDRKNNFSYAGLEVLFDYLEGIEEDTSEELELDVIALCCDFSEHTEEELLREYNYIYNEVYNEEEEDIENLNSLLEELQKRTTVLEVENSRYNDNGQFITETSYIIQDF